VSSDPVRPENASGGGTMLVTQISVFLENKTGRLADVTRALREAGIDIRALVIADTTEYGILRMIVDQPVKAQEILTEKGFTVSATHVIAIAIPNLPGELDIALEALNAGSISIDYMYAYIGRADNDAVVIIRVQNPQMALDKLADSPVRVLSSREVYGI
jgi:hypothetical protein